MRRSGTHTQTHTFTALSVAAEAVVTKLARKKSLALPASEAKQSQQGSARREEGRFARGEEGEGKDGRAGPPSCCGSLIAGSAEVGKAVRNATALAFFHQDSDD